MVGLIQPTRHSLPRTTFCISGKLPESVKEALGVDLFTPKALQKCEGLENIDGFNGGSPIHREHVQHKEVNI